jgi:hypothetical protein
VPDVAELGVGAVKLAVPPEEAVYHFSVSPVAALAVNALVVAPRQYWIGLVTLGALGTS